MMNNKRDSIILLANKTCQACRQGDPVLDDRSIDGLLSSVPDWQLNEDQTISRLYRFINFEKTMQFVNEVAKIAEVNDHHPDASFGYNYCSINYSTHAINGLSENDFICAAQIELAFLNQGS